MAAMPRFRGRKTGLFDLLLESPWRETAGRPTYGVAASRRRILRIEPLEDRHLLNAAPTDILLPISSVWEDQPPGTPVGIFSSLDPDAGDTFTYSLVAGEGDTDNGSFTIDGDQLKTAAVLDYESRSSCSIRVRTTDSAALWHEEVVAISVADVPIDLDQTFGSGGKAFVDFALGAGRRA